MHTYRSITGRLRLVAGLILLFYVFTHLLNHAVGIFGREAIEATRRIFLSFWRSRLLFWVVPTSLIIHSGLALARLLGRRTLRGIRPDEWIQVLSGMLVPLMLLPHFYYTRMAAVNYNIRDSYTFIITTMMADSPILFVFLIVVWIHGTIGLHRALALKSWYGRVQRPLEMIGLLLPVLAIVGVVVVRREIEALRDDPAWLAAVLERGNPQGVPLGEMTRAFAIQASTWYLGGLGLVMLGRITLLMALRRFTTVQVEYLSGPKVAVARGTTLLEASLQHGIPHAHQCGGRGRCSTCRVQIIAGLALAPISGWPARPSRPDRARSTPCCPIRPRRVSTWRAPPSSRASIRRSPSCLSICADSRPSPRTSCPTTPSLSSTSMSS
jgi:adenylate cyclase